MMVRSLTAALTLVAFVASSAQAETVTYARDLNLSPDGKTLAFSWAGDIWTVSTDGGNAQRLTVNPATERHPIFSPDGAHILFASNRHGASNLFVMRPEGTQIRRLTYSDRSETPNGWTPDGSAVHFHSEREGQVEWLSKIYQVSIEGGQPVPVMNAMGFDGRLSPDGEHLAFTRGASRWWRTGYRGSANWDIWVRDLKSGEFTQLTNFNGTDYLQFWDPRSRGVYFLSDREGLHNVWYHPLRGSARQITEVTGDHRVRDYHVSADGRMLAYAVWDKLFVRALPNGDPREITVTAASDSRRNPVDLRTYTSGADEAAVSPTGDEIAVVVHGEIFVIKTADGKPTRRLTESAARDQQITWSPDGKAIFFVSDLNGQEDIYRATSAEDKALSDSLRFTIERVTDHEQMDTRPSISPDGKHLAFVRGLGHLIVRDLKTGEETTLLEAWNWPSYQWSPDSKWITYAVEDEEYNPDVWIVPADGSAAAVNISQHPDYDGNPQWSADGKILAFASTRTGFDSDLYMVFLDPELEEMSSADRVDYFEEAGKAVKKRKALKKAAASGKILLAGETYEEAKPEDDDADEAEAQEEEPAESLTIEQRLRNVLREFLDEEKSKTAKKDDDEEDEAKEDEPDYEYDLEGAYRRLRLVTSLPENQSSFVLDPTGEYLLFNSSHEGSSGLFRVKWDGGERKRVSSGKGQMQFLPNGSKVFYLSGGRPGSMSASGSGAKSYSFRGKMAIDFREEAEQKFNDAARMLGARFYHPTLKGLDWQALTNEYRELALTVNTYGEFNDIFNMLQGLLNGSHLGMFGPSGSAPSRERVGYLGVYFDYEHEGPGLKIARVVKDSPADREESKLYVGDVILKIDGMEVGPDHAIHRALVDTIGDPVIVEFEAGEARRAAAGDADEEAQEGDDGDEAQPNELVIRPISYGQLNGLHYVEWVEQNRKYVEEQSNGRIAYTHISGMGTPQFWQFERDLYAVAEGKDGLIVDVRNNGGGWTADWVMAVLNVYRHAYTIGRGGERGYPQGRLIFYSWPKPATMMCNEFSYSNAEIVSHAFKNLDRGPLVGNETFGAVISTGGYGLIDGTFIRMPFRGWYTLPEGKDMEVEGAKPTHPVKRGPTDEEAGTFPQLDVAIKATLKEIEAGNVLQATGSTRGD